jgi:hypothetical protein
MKTSPVEYTYVQVGTLLAVFSPPNTSSGKNVEQRNAVLSITSSALNCKPENLVLFVLVLPCVNEPLPVHNIEGIIPGLD